jgi:nitrate/TMAO reductase-like tetraheme cytochrome c subunit
MVDETRSGSSPSPSSEGQGPTPAASTGSSWRRFTIRWLKRLVITILAFVVLSGALVGVAEHRTSKPEFCGSCHIMEPYFESWHADVHGGKLEVACVECHYAPGERTTITAKLRGLSQVASYVSGRYGTSRPRAHVDNRSCLASKCHGDMRFMDKEITVGTVKFKHAKHMQQHEEKQKATGRELEDLTQVLQQLLGKERLEELEKVAQEAIPATVRDERMTVLARDWDVKVEPGQLIKFAQLQHRQVRIAQLADLQCTNCHSYVAPDPLAQNPGKAHHFTVKTTSCYTCHFNNEGFNTGTATCLMCHTLPSKEILVHPEVSPDKGEKLKSPELAKQAIRMDHQAMLNRKVDCIACHADVATENATVTRRDCERCHDRPDYFEQWKQPLSLDLVQHYHAVHVPNQRAKCLDCHAEIHHQLVRGETTSGQPGFLSSVMANCTHCHPNHHVEQVHLLSGMGGMGVPKSEPNMMFGSRTNCFGCHTKEATTEHGGVTFQGTLSGCIACHGDRHSETFEKWKRGLKVVMLDAEEAYTNARKKLESAKDVKPETRRKATELLSTAQADLQLVKRGNGVHNVMYAIELLDSVTKRCQEATSIITKDGGSKP